MFKDENRHYSLRKLSVGLASVLIGISFASSMNSSSVKADTVESGSNSVQTVVKGSDAAIKTDAKDDANAIESNTESADEASKDIKQKATKGDVSETAMKNATDGSQIAAKSTLKGNVNADKDNSSKVAEKGSSTNDNSLTANNNPLKDTVESAKQGLEMPGVLHNNSNETTLNVNGSKAEVKESQNLNDPAKSKLKTATLMTTTGKKFNTKMLFASKVVSPVNDTNGGFDSSWGKLNVNDWKGSVQGDYYQLTSYTGDANHIIVPNEADFTKAGISTSGKQVGVTSDLMRTIFRNKTTAANATVAFSKTDNKQVKAIDADWSNTWWHDQYFVKAQLSRFDGTNLDVSNVTNMSYMFSANKISDLSSLANWKVDSVTDMSYMFDNNQISDLSPLTNWKVDSVTDMSYMFWNNQISDLSPLTNWNVNNVRDMSVMFEQNQISDLSPLTNWKVDSVTGMSYMFDNNQISDLSPLTNWNINNVRDMSMMFAQNQISDLSSLANWKVDNVHNMSGMFEQNQISDLSPLINWKVDNVRNMGGMFEQNQISDLSPLTNWKVDNVFNMGGMFEQNQISDLSPLTNWKVDNAFNMGVMFKQNQISDLSPLTNWKVDNVRNMGGMFDDNATTQTKTIPAKRVINFVYPTDYTGKKQDSIIQTVDVPQKVNVELTTNAPKPSNNILDWVTKTETPEASDPVYFQDYTVPEITVPEIEGLLEPDQTVISRQQADITKPINVTVTYEWAMSTTSKAVESNPNDAFALDPKNGLHEHANVNDNGGYDEDYWGKLNVNDWNYTTNDNTITITGYKGNNPSSLIIPNGADFDIANGQRIIQSNVEISSSVMHDLAKNATRIGLSKTANKKVIASNAIWHDAFGGLTNKPGTDSNAYGGIKYGSPNLTQMDLHNLDTATITDMSALFNGGSNLTTVGDLSDWNTRNVTSMRTMFQSASSLTNIGNLDNWNTSKVIDMSWMFGKATNLTNIGNLAKWQTGNVTDMNSMFYNATSLTNIGNLDNWDTNKVTDMYWMFGVDSGKQSHLTNIGDLSKWQTGNVTDMHNMFANATSLTNIGNLDNWDTNKVTDMSWMFGGITSLTNIGDLSKWQTGNVTDMHNMFINATSLTNIGNLDNWNTSKVTDMSWMFGTDFGKQSHLTNIGDLSKWQTGNVTDMHNMFYNATHLTNIGNLDNWNTSNVADMGWMFANTTSLTNIGDLSKWDTSHVTDMNNMFANNALRHLNISNWNLTKLANKDAMNYMFANVTNLTVIANDLKLPTWYQNEVNDSDYFWNNHMAVITNVPELIKATGDINNLKIDDQDASRSIFYDSKGSSDAIQVLKDANNQYIADYHKANPTKFLKLADTVDQNDPIALANASFITVPAAIGLTVHFEDVDPNADKDSDAVKQELAKTVELSGRSGDTADLSQVQLLTNFELSGDLPSVTFGNTDSVTIKLKHKLSDELTSKENGVAATRTNIIAPDGTVLIQGGAGVQSFIDQRQDLVTGEMVDIATHWTYGTSSNINVSSDILNKYIEQYNPAILDTSMNKSTRGWSDTLSGLRQPLQIKLKDGYTVKSAGNWEDWNNNGTYTWDGLKGNPDWNTMKRFTGYDAFQIAPLDQSVHYQFMDNGTQVGSDVIITGKTGETVTPNLSIPENYELADGTTLPTSYTFAATNPTIQINLKHKTETSVESLPATRTINVHLPNGTTKVYEQIIGYQRDVITDLVTKTVTRSTWTVNDVTSSFTIDGVKQLEHSYVLRNGNYNFAGIKLPKVPGYKAKVYKNNGLLLVSYLALAPEKPEINTNSNELQFSNNLAVNSTIKSDLIVKSDMYQVVNDNHNWQLPVIKNYELKFATNKNQIIFAYSKDKQNDYRFVLTFKDGQYRLATFDKENKLLKTYSIKSYDELAKIIHSLVLMNIA